MNTNSDFYKVQAITNGIYACYDSTLKIEVINDKCCDNDINFVLQQLVYNRKEVAKAFIDGKLNIENKDELMELFSRYNKEIISLLGLHII